MIKIIELSAFFVLRASELVVNFLELAGLLSSKVQSNFSPLGLKQDRSIGVTGTFALMQELSLPGAKVIIIYLLKDNLTNIDNV